MEYILLRSQNKTHLLQKFIQKKYNQSSDKQLNDDEHTDTEAKFIWFSVHASHDIHNGLSEGDD